MTHTVAFLVYPGFELLNLSVFEQMKRRFHAPGDLTMAYVIAREVGRHVQTELGITDKVQARRSAAVTRRAPTLCRCAWSCRRIVWPASGPVSTTR
jgi:Putative neutral zinc metallopeptidase